MIVPLCTINMCTSSRASIRPGVVLPRLFRLLAVSVNTMLDKTPHPPHITRYLVCVKLLRNDLAGILQQY